MSSQKAIQGAKNLLTRKAWSWAVHLFVMIYVARILSPSDFGIVAVSLFLINLSSILSSGGFGDYVIYYKGDDERKIFNSVFWLNIIFSTIFFAILFFVAPLWASFYNDKKIETVIYLLAIGFISEMFATVPKAILRKQFRFNELIRIQVFSDTIIAFLKLYFALNNYGVISLVLPMAIVDPVIAIILFAISGLRIYLTNIFFGWKKIISYTKFVIGNHLLTRFVNEGDNVIAGKMLGIEMLGYYNIAYTLANYAVSVISPVTGDISMPVYSQKSENKNELKNTYSRIFFIHAALGFFILSIAVSQSQNIVEIVYGNKYIQAIIPFAILSFFALFRLLNSPSGNIFNATGKPQIPFKFMLLFAPAFLAVVYISSMYGLIFFCMAVCIARIFASVFLILKAGNEIDMKFSELQKIIFPFFVAGSIASAITFLFIYIFNTFFHSNQNLLIFSLLEGVFGILLFFATLKIFYKKSSEKLFSELKNISSSKKTIS